MMIRRISILTILLLVIYHADMTAQKRKSVRQPKKPVVEQPVENPMLTQMLEATQQIVFIDSVVVETDSLLAAITVDPEVGLLDRCRHFFNASNAPAEAWVFCNEMGNKCYYAGLDNDSTIHLFTADKIDGQWGEAARLSGLGDNLRHANYPFMMADGQTLYFAAKGEESLGGYDIFVSRQSDDNAHFFKAENIGMPFNSEANDYLYVIDEFTGIGYFATDRRQPQGYACIYCFIPPAVRHTYDQDALGDSRLRSLAAINSIADTWGNGVERNDALQRKEAMTRRIELQKTATADGADTFTFVINDSKTYTTMAQFRNANSRQLMEKLLKTRQTIAAIESELDKRRAYFHKATAKERESIRQEIVKAETSLPLLSEEAHSLEKQIRFIENQ